MIALAVAASVILLPILLAAIPVKYVAVADEAQNYSFRVRYLILRYAYENHAGVEKSDFRILFFKIGRRKKKKTNSATPIKKKSPKKNHPEYSEKKSKKIPLKTPPQSKESFIEKLKKAHAVLTDEQLKIIIKSLFATTKDLWRVVRPKHIDVTGVIGFENPYHTGLFFGAYETFAGVFRLRSKIRLAGEFNTDETICKLNAKVRGSVSFLRAAVPVVRLLLNKPVRDFLKGALK